jgi:hypothetical protein
MKIEKAIAKAQAVLPGKPSADGKQDPRWQAIITVADHIPENPLEVWRFARKWGAHANEDVRAAIATCVLEHLLQHHFGMVFPLVEKACGQSRRFADTFVMCGDFGQSELPGNARRFMRLKRRIIRGANKAMHATSGSAAESSSHDG